MRSKIRAGPFQLSRWVPSASPGCGSPPATRRTDGIRSRPWPSSVLLEGDQEAVNATRSDAALDVHGGDRLERPSLRAVLVEDLLELVAGHLPAHEPFAKLDDLVLRHGVPPVAWSFDPTSRA